MATEPPPGSTGAVLGRAVFDSTQRYRFLLTRSTGTGSDRLAFVLLNPSTADAMRNDPTIRRCIGYARRWGFGRLEIVNIFAFRTTFPRELFIDDDPVGPGNDAWIRRVCRRADRVVAAWGGHGARLNRSTRIAELLADIEAWCLGTTVAGEPRHPLYLRADQPLVRYEPIIPARSSA